jgi:Cu-Zn family superoxide dismutase
VTARILLAALAGIASSTASWAQALEVPLHSITANGVGDRVGSALIEQSSGGVQFNVQASGVADGEHGFHVHQKGDCGPAMKDGKTAAGMAAGGHYDPSGAKTHEGPRGSGHKGDLPKLTAASDQIKMSVQASRLSIEEIAGRSLIIHEGGDTYSDTPESGGGKARVICGVIPKMLGSQE